MDLYACALFVRLGACKWQVRFLKKVK